MTARAKLKEVRPAPALPVKKCIEEISFDLRSINVILGFALDKLTDSDNYGMPDSEDGEMICNVGQVLIDTCSRINEIENKLNSVAFNLSQ